MELTYNKKHYIYMTINLDNFKIYIGYHYGYIDDNYYGSGKLFKRSIKSKNDLTKVIIEIVDENTWMVRECYWIRHFNSMDASVGYNIREGGQRGPVMIGEDNPMFGRTHTDEVKDRLSRMNKQRYIDEPERLQEISRQHKGKIVSDEFREKRRTIMIGNEPGNRKPCRYNGVEYPSLTHLAKFLGMSKNGLCDRARNPKWGIELL